MAVIFAVCTLLLFGVAALGVDLGNAMNRKKELQTNADLAALAGGGYLPAPSTVPTSSDEIVERVAKYLIENHVFDDVTGATTPTQAVLQQKLVSGLPEDKAKYGQVYYGRFNAAGTLVPSKNYVTVTAPTTRVRFGLASVIGFQAADVVARATAALKSQSSGAATLPFYAYSGCDWGSQIISHATNNPSAPVLAYPTDTNDAVLTPPAAGLPNASPNSVAKDDTATVVDLFGTNLAASTNPNDKTLPGVTALGFFLPDASEPVEVPATSFVAGSSATQVRFQLPAGVAANNGAVYFLRVAKWVSDGKKNPTYTKRWSPVTLNMPYVEIGSATLFCNDGKSAGNFGSLSVFREDGSNSNESTGWLPLNIALGLDEPNVALNPYPTQPPGPNACDNGDPVRKDSDDPNSGLDVNCVVTNVGFPQNAASAGFITDVTGTPGAKARLTRPDAVGAGCGGANGKPPLRNKGSYSINNEVLSCFLTNTTITVSDISNENYAGGIALDPSIWGSPRFFQVPVINQQPATGKKSFPIVTFRYAFLTGENGTATKGHSSSEGYYFDDDPTNEPPAETNGLVLSGNNSNVKLEAFRVTFIHPKAVPPKPGGGTPIEFDGKDGSLYLVD